MVPARTSGQAEGRSSKSAIDELLAAGPPQVIEKLDRPLALFDLERLDVLDRADRRRFVELSE